MRTFSSMLSLSFLTWADFFGKANSNSQCPQSIHEGLRSMTIISFRCNANALHLGAALPFGKNIFFSNRERRCSLKARQIETIGLSSCLFSATSCQEATEIYDQQRRGLLIANTVGAGHLMMMSSHNIGFKLSS